MDPFSVFSAHYLTYTDQVIRVLPPPPARLLDAGCGDGYLSRKLCDMGYSIAGADSSEKAIAFAKILVPEGRFTVCDLRDVDKFFKPWEFDTIVLNAVLEHIHPADRISVLKKLRYVLREDGFLVLSVPTPRLPQSPHHYGHFELEEIEGLLSESGFILTQLVCSHNMSHVSAKILFSRWLRLVDNRFYCLKFVKSVLVRSFRRYASEAPNAKVAGMLVVKGRREG
jgi:2-polyprenyl-3-methyl-5-hydroxy-6-metoxy-1,4-benzoquinol methylase